MRELLGPGDAARRLGVSARTIQRWVREGRLPAVRVGARLKIDAASLVPLLQHPQLTADPPRNRPIRRLLVANRGELVVRIAQTCRGLGVTCVALVSDDEREAWWARQVSERVRLDGSYLDAGAVLRAATVARADAIHPGYGFLAESADFAERVLTADLAWIGPFPSAMRKLGDKAAARRLADELGIPTVPGYDGTEQSDERLASEAVRIGHPVLVKPSAGGGGKGMHVVRAPEELTETLARARREARGAFGDERLVLEKYLEHPRHVEIQVLFDQHGNGIHLGERDCSLQRRHQKVVEEAPSPAVDAALRDRLGEAAVRLGSAAGYVGAGTAEFLVDDAGAFYFIELNARLQVEHPVTELVTGRDLVADQLRIAAGAPLDVGQPDVRLTGHAMEARLYAEDPWGGFVPATGTVEEVEWPAGEGIRVDAGVGEGDRVGTRYDPMLAKVICRGADRAQALERLESALAATRVNGITSNRGFLSWLLRLREIREGDARTDTIERRWHPEPDVPEQAWQLGAEALASQLEDASGLVAFRLNAPRSLRVSIAGQERVIPVKQRRRAMRPVAPVRSAAGTSVVLVDVDGRSFEVRLVPAPTVDARVRQAAREGGGSRAVSAPMPGTVLAVRASEGDRVEGGRTLLVLEAMKMENNVTAPADAEVLRVLVRPGQTVQRGDPLVELG